MSDDKKYFTIDPSNWILPTGITTPSGISRPGGTPSGIYGVQDAGWIGYDGYWNKDKEKKKCECGMATVYGENCPEEYHSDYCQLSKKKKEEK